MFTARSGPEKPVAEVVEFTVAGHEVIGLNAGPDLQLNEAFCFYLRVDGQEEIDHYWEVLTADGGEANQRVCQAMLEMSKINVTALQAAYDAA